jgi:hypothetical protein
LNAALALGLLVHLARELASPREMANTDFTVFRTGWTLILNGRADRLYDAAAQATVQRGLLAEAGAGVFQGGLMAFLHPPHAALAGCGLGWMVVRWGLPAAFWLWTACSVAALVALLRLVRDELRLDARATALAAVTLAAFYPVLETLQQGQVSAVLALAAVACARAVAARRALAAAAWLLALSIKPQTLPALLVVLAARREWRVLTWAAVLGVVAAVVTTLALGGHVWSDYLGALRGLERHFGGGTPEYMPTVRGFLTRLLGRGGQHRDVIDALALASWGAAIVAAALLALRSRDVGDGRAPLAFALAAGALASPHLFPQDVLLWVAPVTLVLAGARDADPSAWRRQTRVVLAWPLWFVLARVADLRPSPGPRLPLDLALVPLVLATVWAARDAASAQAPGGTSTAQV